MAEEAHPRLAMYGLPPGVDQIEVALAGKRDLTEAENAVLGVEYYLSARRDEVRRQHGDPDAQIDVVAVLELLGTSEGDRPAYPPASAGNEYNSIP